MLDVMSEIDRIDMAGNPLLTDKALVPLMKAVGQKRAAGGLRYLFPHPGWIAARAQTG